MAALGCLVSGALVRGDDTPAPAATTGTISGHVTANGSPVAGATVRLMAPPKHHKEGGTPPGNTGTPPANNDAPAGGQPGSGDQGQPGQGGQKHQRPKALQETTTGADGSYTFSNVAPGDYMVGAGLKGTGRGHAKATVTAGAR